MSTLRKRISLIIIFGSCCLLFPFSSFAGTQVSLTNAIGGSGGIPFVDMAARGGRIASITVRSGKYIDSIQITYKYRKNRVTGPAHGGKGGKASTFKLKKGEYITEFGGKTGSVVDSIYIKTNKNRKKSWGGKGGSRSFRFMGSKKSPILGILGRSGSLLDAVGVIKNAGRNPNTGGGNSIKTNGFSGYRPGTGGHDFDDDKSDNVRGKEFPYPSAGVGEVKGWLKMHNQHLIKIIAKLSSSQSDFNNYKRDEKQACGSSLYCEVAYRRGAISYVTGAK